MSRSDAFEAPCRVRPLILVLLVPLGLLGCLGSVSEQQAPSDAGDVAPACGLAISGAVTGSAGCPVISVQPPNPGDDRWFADAMLQQGQIQSTLVIIWSGADVPRGPLRPSMSGATGHVMFNPDHLATHRREFYINVHNGFTDTGPGRGGGTLNLSWDGANLHGTAELQLVEQVLGEDAGTPGVITATLTLP